MWVSLQIHWYAYIVDSCKCINLLVSEGKSLKVSILGRHTYQNNSWRWTEHFSLQCFEDVAVLTVSEIFQSIRSRIIFSTVTNTCEWIIYGWIQMHIYQWNSSRRKFLIFQKKSFGQFKQDNRTVVFRNVTIVLMYEKAAFFISSVENCW